MKKKFKDLKIGDLIYRIKDEVLEISEIKIIMDMDAFSQYCYYLSPIIGN